mgnify:CR=1 FL=1
MKNTIKNTLLIVYSFLPITSFAALAGVKGFLTAFGGLLAQTMTIVVGLAVVYFFWGVGQFILNSGDQKMREDGKKKIMWGVIALFVMFSIFGILAWVGNIFGIKQGGALQGDIFNLP